MLAKLTSKNQITLPKTVMSHFAETEYFDIHAEAGNIVLVPVNVAHGDTVRAKLALLGIKENDVKAAIQWARK